MPEFCTYSPIRTHKQYAGLWFMHLQSPNPTIISIRMEMRKIYLLFL